MIKKEKHLYILGLGDGFKSQWLLCAYPSHKIAKEMMIKIQDIMPKDQFYIECIENVSDEELKITFNTPRPNGMALQYYMIFGEDKIKFKNPYFVNLNLEDLHKLVLKNK